MRFREERLPLLTLDSMEAELKWTDCNAPTLSPEAHYLATLLLSKRGYRKMGNKAPLAPL